MDYYKFSKIWFYTSILSLVFLYGAGVGKWGWFPASFLDKAVSQARSAGLEWFGDPVYLRSRAYDKEGVKTPFPKEVQPGLTVITSSWKGPDGWNPELRLIDAEGKMVHKWRINRSEVFQGAMGTHQKKATETEVHGSYLLPNGDVLFNLGFVGMARMDACGDVEWALKEGNHHSIAQSMDGSFWVPGVSRKRHRGSDQYPDGYPGFRGKKVWHDRILNISNSGDILEDINVLNILYKNNLEKFIFKNGGMSDTHLNDVEPLTDSLAEEYPMFEAGDLLVSLRNVNLVFVFNPYSKEVKWYTDGPFIEQHDPDFIGEGWIGIFDNNIDNATGKVLGGSRIVALQPHTDSVEVLFPTSHSEPFYTRRRGKWQMLENGNMLLTETRAGRIVEVNSSGRTVWEWVYPPTENSKVASTTKAHRVSLTREEVASWPCSSVDSISTSAQKQQTPQ
jgi:hypothetical protein